MKMTTPHINHPITTDIYLAVVAVQDCAKVLDVPTAAIDLALSDPIVRSAIKAFDDNWRAQWDAENGTKY